FGVGEALVAWIRRRNRGGGLARHALDRARPQIEIGLAQHVLQVKRSLRIGEPVLHHLAERLHGVGDEVGVVLAGKTILARRAVGLTARVCARGYLRMPRW